MLRQFISRLSAVRPNVICAVQPIRFYSVESTQQVKNVETEGEDDKLYKRLEIELKGHDKMVLKSYVKFATTAAHHLNIEVGKSFTPRLHYNKELYVLLKSAFVHKKHRVQYEIRTYFHFIHFHRLTGSTLSTYLEYIERNLPEGVALKATKVESLPLPEHMQKPPPLVENEQTN
ncbi:28S ribosomal protein S10, mitochondrial [Contarinia nasturtii]|uniref:28S ribosomal protein S10, mitochondrial n=1 Tax=Contarinia nasturtii TaxID=265458 RepID=UPI0012D3BF4C|nr:28S ribosomal protein S10, mitochondrial [Contarinia nasturtii]